MYFVRRGGRFEIEEGLDVAAHVLSPGRGVELIYCIAWFCCTGYINWPIPRWNHMAIGLIPYVWAIIAARRLLIDGR